MAANDLTAAQVARRLRVCVGTVRRWVATGVIAGNKSPFNGRFSVPPAALDAFVKRRTAAQK